MSVQFANNIVLAVDPLKNSVGVYDEYILAQRYRGAVFKDTYENAIVCYVQPSSTTDPREVRVWNYPAVFNAHDGLLSAMEQLLKQFTGENFEKMQKSAQAWQKMGFGTIVSSTGTAIASCGKTVTAVSKLATVLGVEEKFVAKAI